MPRVVRVVGDGDCMFRAISQGLHGGTLGPASELAWSMRLRAVAVAYNCRRRAVLRRRAADEHLHCVAMRSRGTYGEEEELDALSRALRVRIAVYTSFSARSPLITYGPARARGISLWYHDEHYDAVLDL